jgi:hypothetical protein
MLTGISAWGSRAGADEGACAFCPVGLEVELAIETNPKQGMAKANRCSNIVDRRRMDLLLSE